MTPAPKSTLCAGVVVIVASLLARWMILDAPAHVDEPAHMQQVAKFVRGDYRLYVPEGQVYPFLAMIPGYHLLVAAFAHLLGSRSLNDIRGIALALSLLLLPTAYGVARHFDPVRPGLRAAQLFCFPTVFALSFVLYTDVFALTLSLASLAACLAGRFAAGGLLGFAGLLVRQTNIVFLTLTPLFAYFRLPPATRPSALEILARSWAFFAAIAFLAAFVTANDGRLPLCSPKFQSVQGIHGINVLFSAATGAALLLPWLIFALPRTWARVRRSPRPFAAGALLLLVACLLVPAGDIRNRVEVMPELLRNYLLQATLGSYSGRLLMAVAAGWLIATAFCAGFERYALPLVALVWLGTLLPVELVEPRYYLPTYAVLILLRPPLPAYQEWIILGYSVAGGLALHWVHTQTAFFL